MGRDVTVMLHSWLEEGREAAIGMASAGDVAGRAKSSASTKSREFHLSAMNEEMPYASHASTFPNLQKPGETTIGLQTPPTTSTILP